MVPCGGAGIAHPSPFPRSVTVPARTALCGVIPAHAFFCSTSGSLRSPFNLYLKESLSVISSKVFWFFFFFFGSMTKLLKSLVWYLVSLCHHSEMVVLCSQQSRITFCAVVFKSYREFVIKGFLPPLKKQLLFF